MNLSPEGPGGPPAPAVGERRPALTEALRRCLESRIEILESYLFGSVVRGDDAQHSDLDVAIYLDPEVAPDDTGFGLASELAADLEEISGGRPVDVVVLNQATPLLYHRVLRDGVRLTTRDLRSTTTREGRALSRYFDDLPRLRLLDEALRRRIASGSFGR